VAQKKRRKTPQADLELAARRYKLIGEAGVSVAVRLAA